MGLFLPCHPKTGHKHQLMAEPLEEGSCTVLPNEVLVARGRSSDWVIKAIPALGDLQTNKALVVN